MHWKYRQRQFLSPLPTGWQLRPSTSVDPLELAAPRTAFFSNSTAKVSRIPVECCKPQSLPTRQIWSFAEKHLPTLAVKDKHLVISSSGLKAAVTTEYLLWVEYSSKMFHVHITNAYNSAEYRLLYISKIFLKSLFFLHTLPPSESKPPSFCHPKDCNGLLPSILPYSMYSLHSSLYTGRSFKSRRRVA